MKEISLNTQNFKASKVGIKQTIEEKIIRKLEGDQETHF
jgi:hypothetical protein